MLQMVDFGMVVKWQIISVNFWNVPFHVNKDGAFFHQMNFSLKVPRPSHSKSDPQEQQDWKKKLTTEVEKLQKQYPEAQLSVWSQDEHRIGLPMRTETNLGGAGPTTTRKCQLETGMVMVICLCRTRNWPN